MLPAFQLRNLKIYVYTSAHLSLPSTEMSPQAWGQGQVSTMGLETLGAPTLRKGGARTPGQVLLTPEEGGGCRAFAAGLDQGLQALRQPHLLPLSSSGL